ncbi:hypothetical protein NEUTE1DRAFT_48623 [Neurospora tetrasperma FGSC 2508]|uniref:Uncharacterized protein n=1 Tax=Neurospora tetrasperma (strain FGSC 2508 / ATCC MYA-4615 / P0657) TaxID=510951 RepID=F8MVR6_NEUT8|nr:uncharacterized protein NEUTE1DRAFT_48623 [Neurospora tetrasperma FGSC 2508]EGO54817.1 hypothetical protein NEUTE1DRAFT_48623 [Neurospora tetrasperma FGSC 2508]EGZ67697.1 hypothetical protein NEUTE2DRAFT_75818 [Neurospora tetrasperma FGSC 2509]
MASNATEANNRLDSSSRALSRPEILNTSRKTHPARNIVSNHRTFSSSLLINSIANRHSQTEMAWSSRLLRDNVVAEALAVVQALQLAHQRLRTLPPGPGGPKLATVHIFTGALHVFRDIVLTNNAWSANRSLTPHAKLLRTIQVMMFEQSQKLGDIPDLEVDLHLYWLTAESSLESQRAAKRVALQCRLLDGEQNMFTLDGEARLAAEMPPSVYLDVEHALIQKSKDHKEKSNEKSAAAGVPRDIICSVGYHDSWYGQSYDPCPEPYVSSFSDPEDFYDSDLEVHESIEISPSPSRPSNPVSYTSGPPPMGGPPDMVSNIPFPGTNKPLWWRDLGPARPTIEQTSQIKDSTPSIEQDDVPGTEKATVTRTEATAEEEDDWMEEHVLEQCIRFMQERRMRGHREEPVLERWQEVCLKELRLMAPGNPIVRAHEAKRVRINRLLDQIHAMRVNISQRQKLVSEKDKEVRHLARDQPFFFGASFS